MRRTRWARVVRVAGLVGLLSVVLTGCSAADWEKRLRFGWPTGVTRQATEMRVLWTWAGVAALALGVFVWGLMFWASVRYRQKRSTNTDYIPRQTKYNLTIELAGVVIPFIIIGVLFYRTAVVEDNVNHLTKNPDVRVQVDAFKWNWEFEYIQNHGQATTYGSGDPSANAPLSTVGSDQEIPVLVIPVNERVRFDEHSYDVIHSFWVPEFLFKRDVIPFYTDKTTRDNQFEITPTHTGSFVGRCAELCGTYHAEMNFEVRVVTADQFQAYLDALKSIGSADPARQSKALTQAKIPGGPVATTTHPFDTNRNVVDAGPSTKGTNS
ncbi:MAG: aa3-type cytochrome oxidase subunit II [Jatrophihabitans sp.]|uniref:aa3-type cytochrome oxidase subunit II n=1 Tax=Jatrophihabitans sp. TaxID=1932789 RepID=UPI003F7F82EC